MARPYTIAAVVDVPANDESSLIEGKRGRTLDEPSRVRIFANREAIDVVLEITIGDSSAGQGILAQINTLNGSKPVVPDDLIVDSFGMGGEEIVIRAQNLTAGALEARVLIFVTAVSDVTFQQALGIVG